MSNWPAWWEWDLELSSHLFTHRPPTHPGEMLLEEFPKPLGVTQSSFAVQLGVSFPRLNEVIRGKRSVTPDTALRREGQSRCLGGILVAV